MKRGLLVMTALAFACGNNNNIVGSGQFSAPTALAVVPAADRDLIFVAGTGRDGLRALEICEFVDGDGNLQASCPEDLQFVPGPIRVFPANIETFDRPLHLAGVWLTDAGPAADADAGTSDAGTAAAADGGTRQGVVLVAGADKSVRFVDAKNLLDAVNTGQLAAPLSLPVDGITVDVVADNLYMTGDAIDGDADTLAVSPSVEAFAATLGNNGVPAELTEFTVTLGANGAAVLPPAGSVRKCSLGSNVVPSRLALAPREPPLVAEQQAPGPCDTNPAACIPTPPPPTDDIFIGNATSPGGVARVKRANLVPVAAGAIPPACGETLILDPDGHTVRGLALSPQWYETIYLPPPGSGIVCKAIDATCNAVTVSHPAGELLMMVLSPNQAAAPLPTSAFPHANLTPDPGGVLFADLCTYSPPVAGPNDHAHCKDFNGGTIIPVPPFRYDQFADGALAGAVPPQAMEPIAPDGIVQDGAFLRAFRPITLPNSGQPDIACPDGACTAMYIGAGSAAQANLFLIAAVTSSNGATYFIDVVKRRFVNASFYDLADSLGFSSLEPIETLFPTLTPASASDNPPFLAATPSDSSTPTPFEPPDFHPFDLWTRAGVTHNANWSIVWHDVFPGLGHVGGTLTEAGDGQHFFFDVPPGALVANQTDPVLQLGVGDNVGLLSFGVPASASDACKAVLNVANSLAPNFEAQITAIDGDRVTVFVDPALAFDKNQDCPVFPVIAEFLTGGNNGQRPWVVHQNDTILTRLGQNEMYIAHERRFDYPFDYNATDVTPLPNTPPVKKTDEGLSFTIIGDEPITPGSQFVFVLADNRLPLLYSDTAIISGYATGIVPYSSNTYPSALFTAVTGANSVLMAVPSVLGGSVIGIRAFR
jgi:hypothetical protein